MQMHSKLKEVREASRSEALAFSLPDPLFNIRLGWSQDYDGVFSGRNVEIAGVESALRNARTTGRVLLIGPGGGAKTVILHRLARAAASDGNIVVFIDLKRWTAKEYDEWARLNTHSQRMDFLLLRFGSPLLGTAELDLLKASLKKIVLVDGLNEVRSKTGAEVLDAADDFVRYGINSSVIISDRLVRRSLQNIDRWRLAAVLPLSDQEVGRHVEGKLGSQTWTGLSDSTRDLLRSPYFLDAFLRQGGLWRSKAEELHDYFVRHALNDNEIDRVAEAAFELYGGATRTFSLAAFAKMVGAEIAAKLEDSGALIVKGDLAYFDHHLKHDYLVAKFISSDSRRWTTDNLNILTFNASSFDTVVLGMEQIGERTNADRFLRALYEWNIYGAGYALSEGRHQRVSRDMTVVVHAMFAERRWEIFDHTAKTAEDILNLIDTDLSRRLLAANEPAAVLEVVSRQEGDSEWFAQWRVLFTAMPNTAAGDDDLRHLSDADSVMGWTSSNVLRRKVLTDEQQRVVREILQQAPEPVVRWRAAHVLGRFPSVENADSLHDSITRGTREVRYGSTRSLVEMAATGPRELAKRILARLSEAARQLAVFSNVVDEFQRTLVIKKNVAPEGWTKLVLPTVAAFQQAAAGYKTREDWDRTIQILIDLYGYD
jgi:hypothetical protein